MKHLKYVAILLITALLPGCETLQVIQSKPAAQFAEVQAIKLAQAFFSNGGKMDTAWSIGQGLNFAGDIASFAMQQRHAKDAVEANRLAAEKLKQTVKDFAADKTAVNGLANGVANVVDSSGAKTPEERAKITLAIANGIQKVAADSMP